MTTESKQEEIILPKIEEIFVAAVQATIESSHMLGLTHEQFVDMLKLAWTIDQERRDNKKEKK